MKINPVMYIFANKGLGMSAPKLAAQVAHAAVNAYIHSANEDYLGLTTHWIVSGHYTKIVLEARDEQHLRNIQEYLTERGISTFAIIDEGRTEVPPHSFTALGVQIVDKNDERIAGIFGDFKTYKEDRSELVNVVPPTRMDNVGASKPWWSRNLPG